MLLSMFAGLALVAGFLLFPLAQETDRFFSWTIKPPLTAAFMGAAYWAAFVLIGWAARAGTWELARPALVPVTTIAVLLLVATLVHLDKFDMDSIFGWFWLVVYCSVPPVLARARVAPGPTAGRARAAGAPDTGATARDAASAGRRDGRAGRGHVRRAVHGRGPVALGPDAAHRARRERLPDRIRAPRRPTRPGTTGWRRSPARPTPTRRWERWSCSPPRCSRATSTAGPALRSTSRSPSRCWRSGWPAHSPCAAFSAASAWSRS